MRAIRKLLHWLWVGLDGLRRVLHLLLLLLIFGLIGALFSRPIPFVPDKAALVIAPQGPLVEQFTGDPVERAVADALRQGPVETRLRDLVEAIEAAKDDRRIVALYLDLGGLAGGGTAKLQEVAKAIDEFRTSGKPVIAFGEYYDQPQYYLAARADEIYLDPQGIAYIDGFANYGMFVKDALDKLSIDWNVFRVGQYKSAVEMFTRNDMSPAEREESLAWLNSVWSTWKADVAKARGLEPAALQAYADNAPAALRAAGGDLAKVAFDAGLVTGLKGRYEVEDRIAEITGEDEDQHSFHGVAYEGYLANVHSSKALESESGNKIAYIVASGEILPGEQAPGTIGSDTLAALLREARYDDDVKAVVLRIDSPGGSTFASEVIRREVAELRADGKPVVASMSTLAASGGYYIAMDADRIVASPATLTGSIGIFAMFPTFQRSLERLGVHVDGVGTTALSGEFSPVRPMSDATRDVLQQSIDHEYERFITLVAKSRKKEVAAVDRIAQGRVWSGADAKRLGLVDQLGGPEEAIELAAKLADLGKDYHVEHYDRPVGIGEALGFRIDAAISRLVAPLVARHVAIPQLPRALEPLAQELARLDRLRDPRNVYMYCVACRAER
ncbi:MAG TPA: signal peptide peptidase SppA [Steroidobacteraceae bacterium]|nr:signal peptide peptidase SppA [Steroidobacteraceae bacterium]